MHTTAERCCKPRLWARTVVLDLRELRVAGVLMLTAGVFIPLLPWHAGIACPLRTLTGIPCPLCGMSTSVEATLRWRLGDALKANPAGIAAVVVAVVLVVARPERARIPSFVLPLTLASMWVFELFRFKVL